MDGDPKLFDFVDIPARAQARKGRPRPKPTSFEEIRAMHTWTLDKLQIFSTDLPIPALPATRSP